MIQVEIIIYADGEKINLGYRRVFQTDADPGEMKTQEEIKRILEKYSLLKNKQNARKAAKEKSAKA